MFHIDIIGDHYNKLKSSNHHLRGGEHLTVLISCVTTTVAMGRKAEFLQPNISAFPDEKQAPEGVYTLAYALGMDGTQ